MCILCLLRAAVGKSRIQNSLLVDRAATPAPTPPARRVASFTNFMAAVNGGTLEGTDNLAIMAFMVTGPETGDIVEDLIDVFDDAGCHRDSIAPIGTFKIAESIEAEVLYVITEEEKTDEDSIKELGALARGNTATWLDEGNYVGAVNAEVFSFAGVVGNARRGCIMLPQAFCYERSLERSTSIGAAREAALSVQGGETLPYVPAIAVLQ